VIHLYFVVGALTIDENRIFQGSDASSLSKIEVGVSDEF